MTNTDQGSIVLRVPPQPQPFKFERLPKGEWPQIAEAMNDVAWRPAAKEMEKRLRTAATQAVILALEVEHHVSDLRRKMIIDAYVNTLARCLDSEWVNYLGLRSYFCRIVCTIIDHLAEHLVPDIDAHLRYGLTLLRRPAPPFNPIGKPLLIRLKKLRKAVKSKDDSWLNRELPLDRMWGWTGKEYKPVPDKLKTLAHDLMDLANALEGLVKPLGIGRPSKDGYIWILRACHGEIAKVRELYKDAGLPVPKREALKNIRRTMQS